MYAIFLCAALALFPDAALRGAGLGLEICVKAVIPSLLPFMLVSHILIENGWGEKTGRLLSPLLRPLFGMDSVCSMCFVTGLLGGYPCGARAVAQSAENGQMSKADAEIALAFCNNSGPLFIIGTAGAAVYGSVKIGAALYLSHVVGAGVSALVFGRKTVGKSGKVCKKGLKIPVGTLVSRAASDSGAAIIGVCALIITFSALIEALALDRFPLLIGIFEVSRGIGELAPFGFAALPLAAAYLSWGGLSVIFQTEAVAPTLSKKYFIAGKIVSALSAAAAMLACTVFFEKIIL